MISAKSFMSSCLFRVRYVWQKLLVVFFSLSYSLIPSQSRPHCLSLLPGHVSDLCLLILHSVCCGGPWEGLYIRGQNVCVRVCPYIHPWSTTLSTLTRYGTWMCRINWFIPLSYILHKDYFVRIICHKGSLDVPLVCLVLHEWIPQHQHCYF